MSNFIAKVSAKDCGFEYITMNSFTNSSFEILICGKWAKNLSKVRNI
jgi:hypothetical protein